MKYYTDISKTLYKYRDFLEYNYDLIFAVDIESWQYEQVVYKRPDFYSAPERGDARVLFDSMRSLLFSPEDSEDAEILSSEFLESFYSSSARSTRTQKLKITHRNGSRWIKVKLIKSELFPTHVFVLTKEITQDMQFWDINDLLKVIGNKYTSILSVNLTLDECHLVSGNGLDDVMAQRVIGNTNYTKFIEEMSRSATNAYRNEITSKLSRTFLLSRRNEFLDELIYTDSSGHWYSLNFEYVGNMLSDNVNGLLFISCVDEAMKNKKEKANLFDQLFIIGHRLFIMFVTVDLLSDRYMINRFDGDKRYNALLEGSYSQNIAGLFKYVPEPVRKRILLENSLEELRGRAEEGDLSDRLYSFEYLDKSGNVREVELTFGISSEDENAAAFIAVRDVTEQNKLKRVEAREKEIIALLGKSYDVAFTIDQNTWRINYLKRPTVARAIFVDDDDYQNTLSRLCDSYVAEEDQAYVMTMARPESILREIKRNGTFRFTHKWRKNDKTYWTEWNMFPLPSDQNVLLTQCRNVTEERVAEIKRIRKEEELRDLKQKNTELSVNNKVDADTGFGNFNAFVSYKKKDGSFGSKVGYVIIRDWYSYYAKGELSTLVEGIRTYFSGGTYFRLGGGEVLIKDGKADIEGFARFADRSGFKFGYGERICGENVDEAIADAYTDALIYLKKD